MLCTLSGGFGPSYSLLVKLKYASLDADVVFCDINVLSVVRATPVCNVSIINRWKTRRAYTHAFYLEID
jgi:hypothetical protein